ncbi:hypothetical protein DFH07DRAFT_949610 [Mycena maculata]|uniref:DUF4939 domain-containing protein n=1 Tax=Mycena maculata TaxID=230809 RepID=A0AAD7KB35_9AGAR|nr:hypothetical protein DFH07DRAFT_949610 [Mycena maculata]
MSSPTIIPGLVLNPRTPENPVRYPASPHPCRAAAFSRSVSPIAGPRIVEVPEDPQEVLEDSVHSGGHATSLHLSEDLPERDPAPSIHDGGSNNGDGGDGGSNGSGGGGGGAGPPPGPPAVHPEVAPEVPAVPVVPVFQEVHPEAPLVVHLAVAPEAPALIMDTIWTFQDAINVFSTRPAAPPPRSNQSNLRNLDTFDGSDLAKLSSFLTQCYLHFAERPQDFPDDDDRILYIVSYLRGSAQQWFSPNLYDPTIIPVWDGNFTVFIQELTLNFGGSSTKSPKLRTDAMLTSILRLGLGNKLDFLVLHTVSSAARTNPFAEEGWELLPMSFSPNEEIEDHEGILTADLNEYMQVQHFPVYISVGPTLAVFFQHDDSSPMKTLDSVCICLFPTSLILRIQLPYMPPSNQTLVEAPGLGEYLSVGGVSLS